MRANWTSSQAADVGVGVAGEEGLQAVNSSDYSIAQVRFPFHPNLYFLTFL